MGRVPPAPSRPRLLDDRRASLLLLAITGVVLLVEAPVIGRPLWFDEQWRATHIAVWDGWTGGFDTASVPSAYGWMLLHKLSAGVLGYRDLALRLPMVAMLPALVLVVHRLARLWVRPSVAVVTAALVGVNGSLLVYGLQEKPYLMDAACSALAVYAWERARRLPGTGRGVWGWYTVLAAAALGSLPALLVIAPLLALDGLHALRRRRWRRLVPAVAAGALALGHALVILAHQPAASAEPYWQAFFLSRAPAEALTQLVGAVTSFVPDIALSALLAPDEVDPNGLYLGTTLLTRPGGLVAAVVGVFAVVLWVSAVVAGLRDRAYASLFTAIGGAAALVVALSAMQKWTLGYTRTNLFLVPLLYVAAAVGAEALLRVGSRGTAASWRRPLTAVLLAFTVVAGTVGGRWAWSLREFADRPLLAERMPELVSTIRAQAAPGDVVVVVGATIDADVYEYWMRHADSTSQRGVEVPSTDTLVTFGDPAQLDTFLQQHADARQVFVIGAWFFERFGMAQNVGDQLRSRGWRTDEPVLVELTGRYWRFTRPA